MKKLSILFGALFLLSGVNAFAGYTDPTYSEAHKLNNTGNNQKEPYRAIMLVRFADRNLPIPVSGDAATWDIISADGITIRRSNVLVNGSSADGSFAGIVCATATSTPDSTSTTFVDDAGHPNWVYIVRTGIANASATAGGTNGAQYGDIFITSTDTAKITTVAARTGTQSAAISDVATIVRGKGGFFMQSADGTSTVYKVYVQTQ